MVGDQPTIPNPEPSVSKRSSRFKLLIPVGLVLLAALIIFRATGSFVSGVGSSSTPLFAMPQIGSDRAGTIEQGRKLYGQDCASCHGARGDRVAAAPLNSKQFVDSLGNRLEQAISNGKGTMAAWGRERGGPLSGNDVKAVAEYVRSDNGFLDARVAAPATSTPLPSPVPTVEQRQAPPPVAHALAGLDNRCLDCHNRGGSAPMPVNHAGRTNSTCSLCHAQGPATVTLPSPASAANPAATSPADKPAQTPTGTAAPKR